MKTLFDIATDVEETQIKLEAVYNLLELFIEFYEDEGYISPKDKENPEVDLKKVVFVNRLPVRMALLEMSYATLGEQIERIQTTNHDLLTASKEAKRV